ncbi:MAG: methylated-DNA--[protein]-cysteine S-methyltransferase [Microbacteriaceae bacterium]|nr:methylated-DNA--[protein]-cysteine S-methyltransferase [Microbacteriaceae bacterium]
MSNATNLSGSATVGPSNSATSASPLSAATNSIDLAAADAVSPSAAETSLTAESPPPAESPPTAESPSTAVSPSSIEKPKRLRRLRSPIGRLELVGNGSAVTALVIESAGRLPNDELPEASDEILDRAADQLGEYFAGTRREFELPIALVGTAFQRAVWQELRQIRWGEVASYGEIGFATGRATAGRAVGGAVGANPIPIIVGCHRVLAGNRKITGYSGGEGVSTKIWLLDHEGIDHR